METMKHNVEYSHPHPLYRAAIGVILLGWVGYVGWIWADALSRGEMPWLASIAVQALLLWYIVNTATAKTEYRLEKDELVIVKKSLFRGTKEMRIAYEEIFGVYRYNAKKKNGIDYTSQYYMYSKLDRRDIWVLLYNDNDNTKKAGCVMLKASDEFLDAFAAILPDRVDIPQEEVLGNAYKHMGEVIRRKEDAEYDDDDYDDDEYDDEYDDEEYEDGAEEEADEEPEEKPAKKDAPKTAAKKTEKEEKK